MHVLFNFHGISVILSRTLVLVFSWLNSKLLNTELTLLLVFLDSVIACLSVQLPWSIVAWYPLFNLQMKCFVSLLRFPLLVQFSSVQSLSRVRLFVTPWIAARQASLSITKSRSLLKLIPIESVMPSNYLILCRPLLLLPPIPPSIRVFSNESTLHMRWPKYWSFSINISPSNEHPGLISFQWIPRTDLLQDGLVGSPCSPRDSQESSPTPQFKTINFSALSFLYSPTLTWFLCHFQELILCQC